ncbi:hypothetical protein H072_10054 [Dactylellina haptotyla CBS 200.50]|uniref:Uncharacterized protein n=1 Tax=Dactylellina haptotyla (strain CBS 200.50) TaxID=1284197 RepID=S8BBA2_DACHA|nr:hypothetical protein H072_10054 [Dactylellina haptotyla CBS 200.50]
MIFPPLLVLATIFATASAGPVNKNYDIITTDASSSTDLEERGVYTYQQTCQKVQGLVKLLKSKNLTPFCRSYLNIPTKTAYTTKILSKTVTNTKNTVVYTTVTVVAQTNTQEFFETDTVTTLYRVVETSTISSTTVEVSTETPEPVVVTTTIYRTGGAKRDVQEREVEKRAVSTPACLKGYAPSSISQACKCLSIPTPTVTRTITRYTTKTVSKTLTGVSTNTALSTAETSITITVLETRYVATTTVTTSVTTSTSTTTLEAATSTATVYRPLPPYCVDIISGNKLHSSAAPGRNVGAGLADNRRYFAERNDYTWSQCCGYAADNILDFSILFLSDRGAAAGDMRYVCTPWINSDAVGSGVTAQCPLGVLADGVAKVSPGGATGFALAPCFGNPGAF